MEKILEVSPSLWVVVETADPTRLLNVRDDVGGDTLVCDDEVEKLIAVLREAVVLFPAKEEK